MFELTIALRCLFVAEQWRVFCNERVKHYIEKT